MTYAIFRLIELWAFTQQAVYRTSTRDPHHPDHTLRLLAKADGPRPHCEACCEGIDGFSFYCELCEFHLDVKCGSRVPTRKNYFHEHDLVYFDEIPSLECNRCGSRTDSPLFHCVPCDFNLRKKCMGLLPVMKHKTHFHTLTLRETFIEDDSGEYYCDLCKKRRDGRLGVYMFGLEREIEEPKEKLDELRKRRDELVSLKAKVGE